MCNRPLAIEKDHNLLKNGDYLSSLGFSSVKVFLYFFDVKYFFPEYRGKPAPFLGILIAHIFVQ